MQAKLFCKRIFTKMVILFFLVNLFYTFVFTKFYSPFQFVEIRGWNEKLLTLIAFLIYSLKRII